MTRVTTKDMRAQGICKDARFWFAKHDLDWRDFVRNGIEVDKLRATGDNLSTIYKLEQLAKEREANG